jgi:hypothetical protein
MGVERFCLVRAGRMLHACMHACMPKQARCACGAVCGDGMVLRSLVGVGRGAESVLVLIDGSWVPELL